MREIAIEGPACDYAESTGWLQTKFTSPSSRAWPDRIFLRAGVMIFIEFKAPGEVATRQQAKRHREIRAQGFAVYVVDNLELAYAILA